MMTNEDKKVLDRVASAICDFGDLIGAFYADPKNQAAFEKWLEEYKKSKEA